MWCLTKRVKWINIFLEDNNLSFDSKEMDKLGIMGLRIGKTKQGLIIYRNCTYDFLSWNEIKYFVVGV